MCSIKQITYLELINIFNVIDYLRSEAEMDWTNIEKNWESFKDSILIEWDKLTYESIETMGGQRRYLSKKIQLLYSVSKNQADNQITQWQFKIKNQTK